MKTDSLNRRLRFAPPQPLDQNIVLGERDLLLFEALDRHGPLPSTILFEFTKPNFDNFNRHQKRLTHLYNGSKNDAPFLARPRQQFNSFYARSNHLIYDLDRSGRRMLAEQGRLSRFAPRRSDPFLHQFMGACVSASIELACRKKRIRFIHKAEIFTHEKCPGATRDAHNPLAFAEKGAVPDNLFGLEYPHGGFRFFAVEIDRNTESIERRSINQNSFGKKILQYIDIFRDWTFRERWGLPNLMLLTVTTNANHLANLLDFLKKQHSRYAERFLFKALSEFGTNWQVPREPLTDLLTEPWMRPGDAFDISKA